MAVSNPQVKSAEPTKAPCNGAIPPLENGDRLTRAEFERRYEAMPKLKKAELIEGEVYMPSPVRQRRHSHPHTRLVTWLGNYETDTPGSRRALTAASASTWTALSSGAVLLGVKVANAVRQRRGKSFP